MGTAAGAEAPGPSAADLVGDAEVFEAGEEVGADGDAEFFGEEFDAVAAFGIEEEDAEFGGVGVGS